MDGNGLPRAVRFEGAMQIVAAVQDRLRIDDEWWRERPVSRLYCQVQLERGRVLTLYHDLIGDSWWERGSLRRSARRARNAGRAWITCNRSERSGPDSL